MPTAIPQLHARMRGRLEGEPVRWARGARVVLRLGDLNADFSMTVDLTVKGKRFAVEPSIHAASQP
jgi:hypothetical protein